jgi:hypothetical protein
VSDERDNKRFLRCDYTVDRLMMIQMGEAKVKEIVMQQLARAAANALVGREDLVTYRDERMADRRTYSLIAAIYPIRESPPMQRLEDLIYQDNPFLKIWKKHHKPAPRMPKPIYWNDKG